MRAIKKTLFFFFLCFGFTFSYGQGLNWLLGKWEGEGTNGNNVKFVKTILIDSIDGEKFSGKRTNEIKDRSHAIIITALAGYIDKGTIYITNGMVTFRKDPPNGKWTDCSACFPITKVTISSDRIILTSTITECQKECNSVTVYYKFLCDYDTATQRYLVNRFGTISDIQNFSSCIIKTPEQIAAEKKRQQDSIANAEAAAKQHQKQVDDSLALVRRHQQQIDDSLKTAAAFEKKHQQQVQDSIDNATKIAQQKEQQRIKDSITNAQFVAKKRQQEMDDSLALVKKRQQQVQDSIDNATKIAQQKEQQRLKDSITNAQIVAKKRQQEMDDSLALVKKQQQQFQDSIVNATKIAQQKEQQRIKDSITSAQTLAKQRQKETDDSLALEKKRQQQINDSLKVAATLQKKRQKEIDDSLRIAANVAKQKEQQRIQDSIANAAIVVKQRQQQIDDSLKNAVTIVKKNLGDTVKASTAKAFATRDNVLLQSYHITTPDILIELFDNAQIDGDRVSVYHNNSIIVNNQTLLRDPITIKIHADANNRVHEFVMIAENLGTIPPNTALMRVTVGTQVYKLSVRTDLQTNAKIVFTYDGN